MKLFGEKKSAEKTKSCLYGCCKGTVCLLEETSDEIMSSGILGEGFAVYPTYDEAQEAAVVSPTAARVIDVTTKPNAVVLKNEDGLKILISFSDFSAEQISITTSAGESVAAGDELAKLKVASEDKKEVYVVVENSDKLIDFKVKKGSCTPEKAVMEYSV